MVLQIRNYFRSTWRQNDLPSLNWPYQISSGFQKCMSPQEFYQEPRRHCPQLYFYLPVLENVWLYTSYTQQCFLNALLLGTDRGLVKWSIGFPKTQPHHIERKKTMNGTTPIALSHRQSTTKIEILHFTIPQHRKDVVVLNTCYLDHTNISIMVKIAGF